MAKHWWSSDPRTFRELLAQAVVLAAVMLSVTLLFSDRHRDVVLWAVLFPLVWLVFGFARLRKAR